MKTIAISIEEDMIASLDSIAKTVGEPVRSRSAIVRIALSEYLERRRRKLREDRERKILAEHKDLLGRQAEALVRDQAEL